MLKNKEKSRQSDFALTAFPMMLIWLKYTVNNHHNPTSFPSDAFNKSAYINNYRDYISGFQ